MDGHSPRHTPWASAAACILLLGLCLVGESEASSPGLTSCLHRQLSTMSSEGEGQGRPVPRRRLATAEKLVQAAEAKANGTLIEEEKVEMGKVSRVDKEGWGGWAGPQQSGLGLTGVLCS